MTESNICWNNKIVIIDELNKNYPVYKNIMDITTHVQSIESQIKFLSSIENKKLNVIDIGCGTAQISILFNKDKYNYEGCDIDYIIQYCAKKWHPENNYYSFDANTSNYTFFNKYDLILMNAFIDVMQNPLHILEKVLQNAHKYVLIHRQEISFEKPTHSVLKPSYGAYTYHSIINESDFKNVLKKYNFNIIKYKACGFSDWENGGGSYLLQKNP